MNRITVLLVAIIGMASIASAQSGPAIDLSAENWQSFTNMRDVRALTATPQGIWAATTGGMLFWNTAAAEFERFTNTEGLNSNDVKAITVDKIGRIWLAESGGIIDVYDPETERFTIISDYKELSVNDLFVAGDSMYVALNIGVSLYLIQRDEVKETYKNLGNRLEVETAVRTVFVAGRELWAGTDKGIARASLDSPNLLAPESWTNYTTSDGLPSNQIIDFAFYDNKAIAALSNGVAAFEGDRWADISAELAGRSVLQLLNGSQNDDRLYAITAAGVHGTAALGSWQAIGPSLSNLTSGGISNDGKLWVGTTDAGLYELVSNGTSWQKREPDGPATNNISSVAIDQQGTLWCTSATFGILAYDGFQWRAYPPWLDESTIFQDNRDVEILRDGRRWISTFGRGVTVVEGDLNNLIFSRIDSSGGILSGSLPSAPGFVAVPFSKQDAGGNIWVCNFNANSSNAIAVMTPAGKWHYFSTNAGLSSKLATTLEIERTLSSDRIWVGTEDAGVSVIDYNGTLEDKSDDDLSGELDLDDNLLGLNVRSIAQDRDGFLWIGTDRGLNFWFGGTVGSRFGLISDNIQVVKVDPANNKWIGTSAGISVLSREDNFSSISITIENSQLVSNSVTDFAFNPDNGDVWIATTNGISKLRTPFTAPKEDLTTLTGYPNPFHIDDRGGSFIITNLAENSAVKIYSAEGKLMRSYPREEILGAQITWDGFDQKGTAVPSGVYLLVAFIEETGASAVGKVVVIRR